MQNKYAKVAGRIYSDDFLIFLDSIPRNKKDAQEILKLSNDINGILSKKKISNCILALTFYISTMLIDNDIEFDAALDDIQAIKGEYNAENYIQ
jgi:hypothetical protein